MIYSIDGKIGKIDGRFLERRIKNLTYEVSGRWFPYAYGNGANINSNLNAACTLIFQSNTPNTLAVSYGDGVTVVKDFEVFSMSGGKPLYSVGYDLQGLSNQLVSIIPQHEFTDGNIGRRKIVFEFSEPIGVTYLLFSQVQIRGSLPVEAKYFPNITGLSYSLCSFIESIPDSFPVKLDFFTLSTSLVSKLPKIPDELFNSKIKIFNVGSSFNLADPIASNLFKINQWKDSLTTLSISSCNITNVTASLAECVNLSSLSLYDNDLIDFPTEILPLTKLVLLYIETKGTNVSFIDFANHNKITLLGCKGDYNYSEMPTKWKGLVSLNQFGPTFRVSSVAQADYVITHFYTLVTNEASIVAGGAATPYPNRFRNIAFGYAAFQFTGAKVAPTGYVQGVSNGVPTTSGERVYVLQNQYNHTVTHAAPII